MSLYQIASLGDATISAGCTQEIESRLFLRFATRLRCISMNSPIALLPRSMSKIYRSAQEAIAGAAIRTSDRLREAGACIVAADSRNGRERQR